MDRNARGTCPVGHVMSKPKNVGDICNFVCSCGKVCDEELVSWLNAISTEPCECVEKPEKQLNTEPRRRLGYCEAGHPRRKGFLIGDGCGYVCQTCGRVCHRDLQALHTLEMSKLSCECEVDKYYKPIIKYDEGTCMPSHDKKIGELTGDYCGHECGLCGRRCVKKLRPKGAYVETVLCECYNEREKLNEQTVNDKDSKVKTDECNDYSEDTKYYDFEYYSRLNSKCYGCTIL